MEIWAHEMRYDKSSIEESSIDCVPFDARFFEEYRIIYNQCFHDMREALDIKPYDFLSDYSQIADKTDTIYLLLINGGIVGSVACIGNEIDDLFVAKEHRCRGYGRELLLWAMRKIRESSYDTITLHVADRNKNAIALYEKAGFEIVRTERVR